MIIQSFSGDMMDNYFYGSAITDNFLLRDATSLPRYGHLARKAMMHYLGERYNPHDHGLAHEVFLRQMIREFIAYKIFNRLPDYDWEWLDHSFRRYFNGCFDLNLPYDEERIKAGLKSTAKAQSKISYTNIH